VLVLSQSISSGAGGRAAGVIYAAVDVVRGFGNEQERPDLAALISSGLLSQCLGTVAAFETRGTASVRDTCHITLYYMLSIVRSVVSEPGCEAQIHGVASALCQPSQSLEPRPAQSQRRSAPESSGATRKAPRSASRRAKSIRCALAHHIILLTQIMAM
jgi:hypothetical protein